MLSIKNGICCTNRNILNLIKIKRNLSEINNLKNILCSVSPDIDIPKLTIPEYFAPFHDKYEKFTAIECSQTKRKYTYGDIRDKSTNLSKILRKILKLNERDVVAIMLTNMPEYPVSTLGILKANLIATTISPMFTPDEISRQLLNSNANTIITEVDLYSNVKKAVELIKRKITILVVKTKKDQTLPEGTINFHEIIETNVDFPNILCDNPENVAVLPYSSGTTGLPKGVQLTHRNLVANLLQLNQGKEFNFFMDATENFQEVTPVMLPFYHIFGHSVIMNGFTQYGGKIVTLSKFDLNTYISILKNYKEKSSLMFTVPPVILALTNEKNALKEYLQNVRTVLSGAAPLAASDEEKFCKKFGNHLQILQGYGLTETSPILTSFPNEKEGNYKGSVGKPVTNTQIKIVDTTNTSDLPLPANKIGEILCKGPQNMKGYLNLPEETKKMIQEDGWLRTGDMGYYNEDGFIFIVDRFKELIKVKGNQVPPAELEGIIRSYPDVTDAAVIGIPHETSGELPRAYIVIKESTQFDTNKLEDYVNEKVAKYKRLKGGIVIVKEIPKNATGKILRRTLKEEYLKTGR